MLILIKSHLLNKKQGGIALKNDIVNDIRRRVDIVDIIGERIPLIARGKNFFGVCPFHNDSNPSMCVSREKQIYTCFSCHATGNVYTFLENYEHWDFRETLKYLGDLVGIDVGYANYQKREGKFDKIYEAYRIALKYYQNNLASSVGREAKTYLNNRKINDEIMKEFEIGLSLSNNDLTKLLEKKDYTLLELNKYGLSSDNRDIYHDRIMFPLYDINGKVVAFSGRIYKNNDQNKYLNTKETDIFKKGHMLYHYHIAREVARREKCVIIMEGFMDVIRASTIGVRNTIALMGTALTQDQIQLIKRLSSNIILCLDGDNPGQAATYQAGELFLKEKIEVKVIVLPKEDDPDSFILREGEERFRSLIENAVYFSNYKIRALKRNTNLQNDKEKASYIDKVLEETAGIADEIRVEIILKNLAKEFDIGYNTLEMRFREKKDKKEKPSSFITFTNQVTKEKTKYVKAVENLIYFMLTYDWVITETKRKHLIFPEEKYRITMNEIFYYYEKHGIITIADFYTYVLDKQCVKEVLDEVLQETREGAVTTVLLEELYEAIRENSLNLEINRLKKKIEEELDPLEQARLAEQIRKLRIGD